MGKMILRIGMAIRDLFNRISDKESQRVFHFISDVFEEEGRCLNKFYNGV